MERSQLICASDHGISYPWIPGTESLGWAGMIGFLEEVGLPTCDGGGVTDSLCRGSKFLVHPVSVYCKTILLCRQPTYLFIYLLTFREREREGEREGEKG